MVASNRLSLALVLAALLLPAVLHGQDPTPGTLSGVVVDAESGDPVAHATIEIRGTSHSTRTDASGRFTLRGLPEGAHRMIVQQIGYVQRGEWVDVPGDVEPLYLPLQPDPIVLRGIEVQMDRFEQRRRRSARPVRAFDRETLLAAPIGSMSDWIPRRAGMHIRPCRDPMETCVLRRGRTVRVSVFIDGQRALGGMEDLMAYAPEDIHLIEVWGGTQVRVYTEMYVGSRAARIGATLPPP
jgi:hypothetical protein